MPLYNRTDIMEAYCVLEWDYNRDGWIRERPRNQRDRAATSIQLARLKFEPRRDLCYKNLTFNGRAIYRLLEARYGFPPTETDEAYTGDEGLDRFIGGYLACLLWSENDTGDEASETFGDPLDAHYGPTDLEPTALARVIADCTRFYQANAADILAGPDTRIDCTAAEYAGHDFHLTRNHHGAGFWDGDWPEPAATRLTDAAQTFGEVCASAGAGLVYID